MATGKLLQPKALLKLPKEVPSNIVLIEFITHKANNQA